MAGLLGKDAAMYVPTGTMSNQVALRVHTDPGDIVIAAQGAHINGHELGAPAVLSGIRIKELPAPRGTFTPEQVRGCHPGAAPVDAVVPVRADHAGGGGEHAQRGRGDRVAARSSCPRWPPRPMSSAWPPISMVPGCGMPSVASGVAEREFAAGFDTVSVCFSKGLGAPMGSALVGRTDLIDRARRFKQMFGGGFRQAGLMAAGALYAVAASPGPAGRRPRHRRPPGGRPGRDPGRRHRPGRR